MHSKDIEEIVRLMRKLNGVVDKLIGRELGHREKEPEFCNSCTREFDPDSQCETCLDYGGPRGDNT